MFHVRYDHEDRLTAREAQQHPYFAPVRQAEAARQLAAVSSQSDNETDSKMSVV